MTWHFIAVHYWWDDVICPKIRSLRRRVSAVAARMR
jgi:hypothetical protein